MKASMFGLSRIKVWLVAAAGGVVAILLLLLRIFNLGKDSAKSDQLKDTMRESDELQDRLAAGHAAGADAAANGGELQYDKDPNDRANRRKNRT